MQIKQPLITTFLCLNRTQTYITWTAENGGLHEIEDVKLITTTNLFLNNKRMICGIIKINK